MRGVRRIIAVLLVLMVLLLVLSFVLENQQEISLSFVGWVTPQLPASVFLTLSLIAGMVVGPAIGASVKLSRFGKKPASSPN